MQRKYACEDMYTPLYEGGEENSDKDEGDEKQIYFTTSWINLPTLPATRHNKFCFQTDRRNIKMSKLTLTMKQEHKDLKKWSKYFFFLGVSH